MDESRIIIDWKEQGDDTYDIEVVGYRNFKQYFSEAFYSIEKPLSVLSVSDSSISGEIACKSATSTLINLPKNKWIYFVLRSACTIFAVAKPLFRK